MSELQELTDKLEKILDTKKSVQPSHFWAGIGLTIISMVAIGAMTLGTLSSEVSSNTENRKDIKKHTTQEAFTNHDKVTDLQLDNIKKDLTTTNERVDKLEKKHD